MGQTRDISAEGVFVNCCTRLPVGAAVTLEIHLPPLERNTLQGLQLKCEGTVARLAEKGEGSGFAASSEFTLHENGTAEVSFAANSVTVDSGASTIRR